VELDEEEKIVSASSEKSSAEFKEGGPSKSISSSDDCNEGSARINNAYSYERDKVVVGTGVGGGTGTTRVGIEVTIIIKVNVSTILPSFNRTAILY
jgi:hypothetical protein